MVTEAYGEEKALLEAAQAEWIAEARLVAAKIAKRKGWVTANCVRAKCPPPEGVSPSVMGPVFNQPGILEPSGQLMASARKLSHNRKVQIHHYVGD